MEIRLVDSRDDTRWELPTRDYRVVFWKLLPAPVGIPQLLWLAGADPTRHPEVFERYPPDADPLQDE
jgi:hypothetical protein